MKIMTVFGTRPEAIKMAPLVKELEKQGMDNVTVVTAQHREMLDQVLTIFDIKPDYDLDIMKERQNIFDITSNVLLSVKDIMKKEKPDIVLVHGDTTTSFVTSLAAYYLKIKVGHVEAGLRTDNIYSPFPEEMNRRLTGTIAQVHFAPTKTARENLIRENVAPEKIFVVGNTVIDTLLEVKAEILKKDMGRHIEGRINVQCDIDIFKKKIVLITGHRRENLGERFRSLFKGIKELAQRYSDTHHFVYPVHLNPAVRELAFDILKDTDNISLIEPLDYIDFVWVMNRSNMIITDSGGIQEEAPALGKPVFVIRDTTERPEAVEAGTVILCGVTGERLKECFIKIADDPLEYERMSKAHNPYGDGRSSKRIVKILKEYV